MVTQQDDIGFAVGGRYLAERMVRDDGTVDVWRGRDRELDRDVAITRIRASCPSLRVRRRALRAVRVAVRLDLPGLVQVVDLISDRRAVHVITEWRDADDLERRVARDGPVSPATAAMWGLQLLGTLERVHAAGIVHGAVSPRCVVIDDGAARLGDLCAAFAGGRRPPTQGASLAFTAPEVVRGARAGVPSDLYGLGVTLYVAVEGAAPFDAAGPVLAGTTAVEYLPRPMGRDGMLAVLLPALLRTDPTARPSADDVRRDLTAVAGVGSPSRAPQTAPAAAGDDGTQPADAEHALRVADRPAAQETAAMDIDWSQVYAAMAGDAARRRRRLAAAVLTLVLLLGGVVAVVRRDTGRRDVDLPMAPVPAMTVAGDPPAVIGPA